MSDPTENMERNLLLRLHNGVAQDIAIIQGLAALLTRVDPENKDAAAIAKAAQRASDEISSIMSELKGV